MCEPKLIEQAYRFELAPSEAQAVFLGACCGAARFWFNHALDEVKRRLDRRAAGEEVSVPWSYKALCSELDKDWRAERCGWQHEVVCGSYQGGFESLGLALKNFSEGRRAGRRVGFPNFRRKGGAHSESVISSAPNPSTRGGCNWTSGSVRCARRSACRSSVGCAGQRRARAHPEGHAQPQGR